MKVVPNIRNRPRIPLPDEDPYSVAGSGASSGSSGGKDRGKDKPPKLPPRDSPGYPAPGPRANGKVGIETMFLVCYIICFSFLELHFVT